MQKKKGPVAGDGGGQRDDGYKTNSVCNENRFEEEEGEEAATENYTKLMKLNQSTESLLCESTRRKENISIA